jgi:acetyl-CoA acetyltransferase
MGAFKDLSATHLGTIAAKAALASCNVDAKDVQEVLMG